MKTRRMFRSLDQHSGEHRPSVFFAANQAADEHLAEVDVLRECAVRCQELEFENAALKVENGLLKSALASARSERETAALKPGVR